MKAIANAALLSSLPPSLPPSHLNHWQHVADEGAEDPVLHDEHEDGEGDDEGQLQQERRAQVQHAGQRVLLLLLDKHGQRRRREGVRRGAFTSSSNMT